MNTSIKSQKLPEEIKNQESTIRVHKKFSLNVKIQHKLKANGERRKDILILIKIRLEWLCWFQTKQKRTVTGEQRLWSKHKGANSPTHDDPNCVCI